MKGGGFVRKINIRQITFAAMFAALAVVLSVYPFTFYLPSGSRITFRDIPIFLCSFSLGPVFGGLCAFIADLVGTFISNSGNAWNPLFALNAVLSGVLPGILFRYVFRGQKRGLSTALSIIPVNILVSLFLTTLWLHLLGFDGGVPLWALMLFRLLLVAALTAVQIAGVLLLYPIVQRGLQGGNRL